MGRHQITLAIVLLATVSLNARGSEPVDDRDMPSTGSSTARVPSYEGKLQRNQADQDGTAPYLLTDGSGALRAYVRPQPGIDLQSYLGRQVRIESAGSAIRRDGARCINAAEVTLASVASSSRPARNSVSEASYAKQRSAPSPAPLGASDLLSRTDVAIDGKPARETGG